MQYFQSFIQQRQIFFIYIYTYIYIYIPASILISNAIFTPKSITFPNLSLYICISYQVLSPSLPGILQAEGLQTLTL